MGLNMVSVKSASRERLEQIRVDAVGCQLNCDGNTYSASLTEREARLELERRGKPVNDPRW